MENVPVGVLVGIILSGLAYFGYNKYSSGKLKELQSDENLFKKALKDLDEGIKKVRKQQEGKNPDEIEDHWNNNDN